MPCCLPLKNAPSSPPPPIPHPHGYNESLSLDAHFLHFSISLPALGGAVKHFYKSHLLSKGWFYITMWNGKIAYGCPGGLTWTRTKKKQKRNRRTCILHNPLLPSRSLCLMNSTTGMRTYSFGERRFQFLVFATDVSSTMTEVKVCRCAEDMY